MQIFNETQARSLRLLRAKLAFFSVNSGLKAKIFFFTCSRKCEQSISEFDKFVVFFT